MATQDLELSGFPKGEKRWHKTDSILKFTIGLFLVRRLNVVQLQYSKGFAILLPSFLCIIGVYLLFYRHVIMVEYFTFVISPFQSRPLKHRTPDIPNHLAHLPTLSPH